MIAKFFVALIALSISSNVLYGFLPINDLLKDNHNTAIEIILFLVVVPLIIAPAIIAINFLDIIWRKKEKPGSDRFELPLRKVLEIYVSGGALNKYNKQTVERILQRDMSLNDDFRQLDYTELALCEDAILYYFETHEVGSPHAYGTKVIMGIFYVVFFLTLGPLIQGMEFMAKEFFPQMKNSTGMLYLFFPIAIYAGWRGMNKARDVWDKLGPHGRNIIRNLIFYWPVTFPILITLNAGVFRILN